MGNKEAKFKQAFEEIDTSKDHKVSAREFMIFMDPEKNPKVEEIFMGVTMAEIKLIRSKTCAFFQLLRSSSSNNFIWKPKYRHFEF